MEKGAQLWAELINTTGGAIVHHKSIWQMLSWWDHVYPPSLKEYSSHDIILDDGCGVKTKVLKSGSSEPNKGLGCLQAPNAQQSSEFTHRLMQCRAISSRASPAQMSVKYAYSMLNARIFPKVTYSMPTTMFSEDQCRRLNTLVDEVMLNKLHINRHTPKAVLYSSRE